jgi:hypothetical protein
MIVAGSQVSFSPETKTKAESDAARVIDQASRDRMRELQKSETVGGVYSQFMAEFDSVVRECMVENWDGYGAMILTPSTMSAAWRFAQVIPLGICKPSVGAEPDGHITFEWHVSPEKTLSVSVDGLANLHYAVLLGPAQHYGTESFVGVVPALLLELIYQVIG